MTKRNILFLAGSIAFLLFQSCGDSGKHPQPEVGTPPVAAVDIKANEISGEEIYRGTCMACHQAAGEGIASAFPPLAKSDFLANKSEVILQVIDGKSGEMTVNGIKYNGIMPPQNLNDDEIAAVLTYVYSSWGNTGGPVTSEEVKGIRAKKI